MDYDVVVRDLGVLRDSEVTFAAHVDSIVQQMCGVLYYTCLESDTSRQKAPRKLLVQSLVS